MKTSDCMSHMHSTNLSESDHELHSLFLKLMHECSWTLLILCIPTFTSNSVPCFDSSMHHSVFLFALPQFHFLPMIYLYSFNDWYVLPVLLSNSTRRGYIYTRLIICKIFQYCSEIQQGEEKYVGFADRVHIIAILCSK